MRHFSPSGSFSSYSSLHPVSDECSGSLVNLCPFAHITLVSRAQRNISLVWDIFIYLSICRSAWLSVSSAASMSSCLTSPVLPFCLFFFFYLGNNTFWAYCYSYGLPPCLKSLPPVPMLAASFACVAAPAFIYRPKVMIRAERWRCREEKWTRWFATGAVFGHNFLPPLKSD